jgi:polyisoprenoid-binding protein YceI
MKKIFVSAALLLSTVFVNAQTNWKFDVSHTKIDFAVSHMLISETTGRFKTFEGKVTSPSDDFNDAKIDFVIDINSINTEDEGRDKHLKSDDFFNAEKFPKATFKSKSFKKVSGKSYKLTGDLTIRDVTKTVEFDVIYNGTNKDPWGNTHAGFKLMGSINRFDYGLKWNAMMEAGGAMVGETVTLNCNIELLKEK